MFRKLIRRFVAKCIDKESEKFERFSESWNACAKVYLMFKDEYKCK